MDISKPRVSILADNAGTSCSCHPPSRQAEAGSELPLLRGTALLQSACLFTRTCGSTPVCGERGSGDWMLILLSPMLRFPHW